MQLELRCRPVQGDASTAGSKVHRVGQGVGQSRRDARLGAGCRHVGQSRGPRRQAAARRTRIGGRGGRRGVTDLLQVRDLHVRFAAPGGFIRAVTGVSFRVRPQSIVALVGESGSGKSVVSQTILRILPRSGDHHQRRGPVRRPAARRQGRRHRATAGRQRGDAGDPRRPHLDHLPGADDLAVAAAHDRQSGRRSACGCIGASPPRKRTS